MDFSDREFQRAVTEGLVPQLNNSKIAVAICPTDEQLDAKFCVELGAMIMLDKPILAFIAPGRHIPDKLLLVADEVVQADISTPEGQETMRRALERMGLT